MNPFYKKQTKNLVRTRRLASGLSTIALLLLSLNGNAQAPTISRPVSPEDIIRANGHSTTTVKIVFNAVCSGTIRFGLPASVTYLPAASGGGVIKSSGTAGVSIAEASLADLNKPEFAINGVAAVGDEITFTIARRADCGSVAVSKDTVYFISGAGCANTSDATGDTYNLLAPAFSITPATAITGAVLGTTATRSTVITNGGNGASDTVRFYIVYKDGAIVNTSGSNTITANSVNFTPWRTNADTLFYKIYGATIFGGDNHFTSGETVTINEPIRVVKCGTPANATIYNASWGRTPVLPGCQNASGSSAVTMAVGASALTTTITEPTITRPCAPGTMQFRFANTGSGGNAGAMYNVKALFGNINPNAPDVIASVRPPYSSENLTSAITYSDFKVNGSTVVATAASVSTPWIMEAAQFTTDPDGAGVGLEDLDGDGQYDDLAPGQFFILTTTRTYNASASCTTPRYFIRTAGRLEYNQMCGAAVVPSTVGHDKGWQSITTSVGPTMPTLIAGGTPFAIKMCFNGYLNSDPSYLPTDSFYFKMTLPSGLSYIPSTANFNGSSSDLTLSVVGSDMYFSGKRSNTSILGFCFQGDFVYTCGAGGTLNIPYELYWVLDRSCNAIEYLSCSTLSVSAKCPSPCDYIGNFAPSAIRVNYNKKHAYSASTELATASTVPLLSTKTFLPYDTMRVVQPAKQGAIGANTLYYNYELNKAAGADVVSFLGGTIHLMRGATTVSYPMPAYTDLSTATLTKWDWNLSSILGASPLGSLVTGDSVWVDYKMVVTTANNARLYEANLTAPPNQLTYFYNQDAATKDYCDPWAFDIYLLGIAKGNTSQLYPNTRSIVGCGTNLVGNNSTFGNILEPGDPFPGEYRPYTLVDSVRYTLPTGIIYDGLTQQTIDTLGATNFTYLRRTYDISSTTAYSGNIVTIKFPTDIWFDDLMPVNRTQANNTRIRVRATCEAGDDNFVQVTTYTRLFAYANLLTPTVQSVTGNSSTSIGLRVSYNPVNKPAVTVQNNTGVVQGVNAVQHWDVQVNNPSTQTAPNIWVALEKGMGSGGVVVDSVKLLPSLTTIPLSGTYNGTDKWYQLSTAGIASGANQQARVFFHYTSCTKDSIQLKSGWSCTGYPTPNPTVYPCAAASTYLLVDPQPSQVQLSVERHPGAGSAIGLCTEDSVKIVVQSAQAGNLVNPYLTFFPPTGVTLGSPLLIEYPRASGNYQSVTPVALGGGGYQINLSGHTAIGTTGMLGTANANPSFIPLGADREALVVIKFSTDCNFTSGAGLRFNAFGSLPCGQPAIGNGITGSTNGVNITGASVAGSAGINITLSGSTTVSCGDVVTVNQSVLPTSVTSMAGDTIINTLGIGLGYVGGLTSGFTAVVSGGGAVPVVVKVALPTGFVAPGSPIDYSFDISADGAGCNTTNVTAEYQRNGAILSCSGIPCPTASRTIIASSASPNISLLKPSLTISDVKVLDTPAWRQANYNANHVKVFYNNNGTQAYAANSDTIEFFCNASATVPFAKMPLTKSLAIGASDSDQYYLMMPIGSCSPGDVIISRIQTQTAGGTAQCLCSPSSFIAAGVGLPLQFLNTKIAAKDCAVNIEWTYNMNDAEQLSSFEIERSSNGAQFSKVNTLVASNNNYVELTPNSGKWFYRIKAIGRDGKTAYSNTLTATTSKCVSNSVSVYPNPASDKIQVVLQGAGENNSYELIDALGRIVAKGSLKINTSNSVDVSGIPQGSYIIKVVTNDDVTTQQLQIAK